MSLPQPSISRPRERYNHLQVSWPQSELLPSSSGRLACRHHLTGREPRLPPPSRIPASSRCLAASASSLQASCSARHHKEQSTQNCKTVFASPVHPTVQDPEEPSRASLRLGRLASRLLFPRARPRAEAEGGSQLPSGALCALGRRVRLAGPQTARDCLSGSPPASPCAGAAAHSGLMSLFLSLPPFIYQA